MLDHSLGNTQSPYTSWTSSYSVAQDFATNGGTTSGAILTNTFGSGVAMPVDPNVEAMMEEYEYLVEGRVSGANVTGIPQ